MVFAWLNIDSLDNNRYYMLFHILLISWGKYSLLWALSPQRWFIFWSEKLNRMLSTAAIYCSISLYPGIPIGLFQSFLTLYSSELKANWLHCYSIRQLWHKATGPLHPSKIAVKCIAHCKWNNCCPRSKH